MVTRETEADAVRRGFVTRATLVERRLQRAELIRRFAAASCACASSGKREASTVLSIIRIAVPTSRCRRSHPSSSIVSRSGVCTAARKA